MPLPGRPHPSIVIQPLIFVALTLANICAVTNASSQPMRMPCTTSLRTVLAWPKNPWKMNQPHTPPPISAVRKVDVRLCIWVLGYRCPAQDITRASRPHEEILRRNAWRRDNYGDEIPARRRPMHGGHRRSLIRINTFALCGVSCQRTLAVTLRSEVCSRASSARRRNLINTLTVGPVTSDDAAASDRSALKVLLALRLGFVRLTTF
jgi:hypothetical protein